MKESSVEVRQTADGEAVVSFRGSLTYENAGNLLSRVFSQLDALRPARLVLDLGETDVIDSAGVSLLRLLARHCQARHIEHRFESVPASAEYFIGFVPTDSVPRVEPSVAKRDGLVRSTGDLVLQHLVNSGQFVRFVGDFAFGIIKGIRAPSGLRWQEIFYYIQLAGSNAMPTVFLLCFLLGLVMAFQAAVQLRQFGANIYVADLVGLAMTRELGPIFTAIILAGRSGSAFAAEIGSMKVNEEVDALTVMGFDVTQFLVIPKVLALAFCGPLLTMWSSISGILGGMVVGSLSLDLTPYSYLLETYHILTVRDVATGLVKNFAFSILVALAGCYRGIRVEKGADSVGRQTTSAVVTGIFLIIISDAIFTVIFHVFGL